MTNNKNSSSNLTPNLACLPITKSDYLLYLACKHEFWLRKHHPEEFEGSPDEEALHIMQQGNAIEQISRGYFRSSENQKIFIQKEYSTEKLHARADIVITNFAVKENTLIEVKSGTSIKDEYINDLAFQYIAAEATGTEFVRIGVLLVNKDYVFAEQIDPHRFLNYEEVTQQVLDRISETRKNIEAAIAWLQLDEQHMPLHEFCGDKLNCPALQRHHSRLPSYTVFDVSRLSTAKLQSLLSNGIVDIRMIPDDFQLSGKQQLQVQVAKSGNPYINLNAIAKALNGLRFPLYFLDYESLAYGIPLYPGVKPYQQMVFQWSLHIMYNDGREMEHLDFLSDGTSHPTYDFAAALQNAIPDDGGTVVVWNKGFESGRNNEIAAMFPIFKDFMHQINNRMYDLMEIFQQQHYTHPDDKGSYSIKQILPILAPDLTYSDLDISHGQLASIRWFEMVTGKIDNDKKQKVMDDLRAYCCLDTLAMVEIYKALLAFK